MDNHQKSRIKELGDLVKLGYIEVSEGFGTQEESPDELRKYLANMPEHLIMEVHRKPIGKIDGVTQYSGAYVTIYIDRKSYIQGSKK